jgi:hypothetical protein
MTKKIKKNRLQKLFLGTALVSSLAIGTSCSSTKNLGKTQKLKDKIETVNKDSLKYYELNPEQYATGTLEEYNKVANALSLIGKTDVGKYLLAIAKSSDIKIMFSYSGMSDSYGEYNRSKKLVLLSRNQDDYRLVNTLSHELSHATQARKRIMIPIGLRDFNKAIAQGRAIEADAETRAFMVAYELKEKGFGDKYLKKIDPNMAREFRKSIKENPENLKNGEAMRAVFDAWFQDEKRMHRYDKDMAERIKEFMKTDQIKKDMYINNNYSLKDHYKGLGTYGNDNHNYLTETKGKRNIYDEFYYSKVKNDVAFDIAYYQKKLNKFISKHENKKTQIVMKKMKAR